MFSQSHRLTQKFLTNLSSFTILLFSFLIINCAGNLEKELEKLDKIYGYCDNPQRNIRGAEYEICKDKERAAGPSGISDKKEAINLSNIFDEFNLGSNRAIVQAYVNPALWRASLEVMRTYDLKFVDNQGGYLQTEWIYQSSNPNNRCLIKIQITSLELISNGVKSSFNCEENNNGIWETDGIDYIQEEKNLNLRILELAQEYATLQ